jgi:hypothetical protein
VPVDTQVPETDGSQTFLSGLHWARKTAAEDKFVAVTKAIRQYKAHLNLFLFPKSRRRKRQIEILINM